MAKSHPELRESLALVTVPDTASGHPYGDIPASYEIVICLVSIRQSAGWSREGLLLGDIQNF